MKEEIKEKSGKKVDQESALKDFEKWIFIKKIRDQKRQENAKGKFEDVIVSSIAEGDLSIDENGYITQKLIFPIIDDNGNDILTELRFIPRIPVKLLNIKLKGVDASDADKRQVAYVSALTQVNMGILEKLDSEDSRISQAIVMYFL